MTPATPTRHLNREEARLVAVVRQLNVDLRLTPGVTGCTLSPDDVRRLLGELGRVTAPRSHPDVDRARATLWGVRDGAELPGRAVLELTGALSRVHDAVERDQRIRRGQIPGALSAGEAMTLMRQMGRW